MRYVRGDATLPQGEGDMLIAHVVNNRGGWGKGFALTLRERYPIAEESYRRWSRRPTTDDPPFALGAVQFVSVAPGLWVASILAQRGYRSLDNPVPLDYDALARGLDAIARFAATHNVRIHMPRIGADLAGGDWDVVAALIRERLSEADVTVYDLP